MRLDKFLKISRIVKRREIAKKLCDDGDIFVNSKVAKPSTEIKPLDELFLILGRHRIKVKVLEVREFASKADSKAMFEIHEDKIVEDEQC